MRDAETTLQKFGEFLLTRQLVRPKAAPFFVRYVRLFLARPASDEPIMDQVRRFCEDLERAGHAEDWQVRLRLRTRHYSYRTECSCVDWVRRFLTYLAAQQQQPRPRVDGEAVRSYLTYLAVHQRVSASTQNQALAAILFLCRNVLGLEPDGLAQVPRAKRGDRLPVVLSIPDTAALLSAIRGTPRIRARLIYGGGLLSRHTCC